MQVRKQQLELYMEQQTGSKSGKEYIKTIYCHPAYLTSMQSRDITLPTKVHLVKAMVFPVVMYGCESWTVKKAECQRIDAFES